MDIFQLGKAGRKAFDLQHLELAPVEILSLHLTLKWLLLVVTIFILHVGKDHEALILGLPLTTTVPVSVVAAIISVALRSANMVSSLVALQRSKKMLLILE